MKTWASIQARASHWPRRMWFKLSERINSKAEEAIRLRQHQLEECVASSLLACSGSNALSPQGSQHRYTNNEEVYHQRLELAIRTNKLMMQDQYFKRLVLSPIDKTGGLNLPVAAFWLDRTVSHSRFPLPLRSNAVVQQWRQHSGSKPWDETQQRLAVAREEGVGRRNFEDRPFGVNLICHAFDILGIGEDGRAIAAALKAANIPFCVVNHPARQNPANIDRTLEDVTLPHGVDGPYAFNLVAMAAPSHAGFACMAGISQLQDRYTIVSWPWELEKWPDSWKSCLWLADEAWPYSSIIEKALTPFRDCENKAFAIKITPMPKPVEIRNVNRYTSEAARTTNRARFGLAQDNVVFIFGFDLNSYLSRKNPYAVIDAFQQAFPKGSTLADKVSLVIKTLKPLGHNSEWDKLKLQTQHDSRILIIESSLDRDDLLGLYGCCDCFVSLHRSEGLGRGHAEALQMGLDVIVTDYSSTIDFCQGPLAHKVDYNLVTINPGDYLDSAGQLWADANIVDAAEHLARVAQLRLNESEPRQHYARYYQTQFTYSGAGKEYAKRLKELWQQRRELATTLKGNQLWSNGAASKRMG